MNYEDLAFKPAMTWDELCNWVWDSKYLPAYTSIAERFIDIGGLSFNEDKSITFYGDLRNETIAENISYDRMKTIIEALYGED